MEGRLFRRAGYPSFFLWKSGRGYDKMRGKGKTLRGTILEIPENLGDPSPNPVICTNCVCAGRDLIFFHNDIEDT